MEVIQLMGINGVCKEYYKEFFNLQDFKLGVYFLCILFSDYNYVYMFYWVQDVFYICLKNLQIGYFFKIKGFN